MRAETRQSGTFSFVSVEPVELPLISRFDFRWVCSHLLARILQRVGPWTLSMGSIRFAEAAGAIFCGHIACSAASMGNSVLSKPPARPEAAVTVAEPEVTDVVSKIYSGGGLDPAACTADVTFTDPAARCAGRGEVCEAFRALRACRPEHVEEPVAVGRMPDGSVHVHLHQRYSIITSFTVKSVLVVRTDASGRLSELEERWNGAPLLDFAAFRWVRRVNGVISSLLTPMILPR
jgi:hypothetical protein